jgi:hypothetical protein
MELTFDNIVLMVLGLATIIFVIVGTARFVKKHKDPGSEVDYRIVRQLSFWFLVIVASINIGMALISAGVEPANHEEKINTVSRWILHVSLELMGFFCLIAVGYFLVLVLYSAIWSRKLSVQLWKNKKNKELRVQRNRAVRLCLQSLALLCICVPMGIAGPYENAFLVSLALDQSVQFKWWFMEINPLVRAYDYSTLPFALLRETSLTEADAVLRGGVYYLPGDYRPLNDMNLQLQSMCILFYFNIMAGLVKGLFSVPHYLNVLEKEVEETIMGKKPKKDKPSESKKETKKEKKEKKLSENDMEEYLAEILEFYGYEDDELDEKVETCITNFESEDYDEVIQDVSNNISSIINKLESLEKQEDSLDEDEYNSKAYAICESINRIFRKRVVRGGLGVPLSNTKYKKKYPK